MSDRNCVQEKGQLYCLVWFGGLLHAAMKSREIDGLDQKRRETPVAGDVGNDIAHKRKKQTRNTRRIALVAGVRRG